jgi:anaerobic ribonucleoside-triphosphate reductase activating protein
MNYATIKTHDIANGPGVRVSLYVSGCPHHCKNCFNTETWDFAYGEPFDEKVEEKIFAALEPKFIKGFSLLGGEPFAPENSPVLAGFLKRLRERFPDKSIWCYTGYDFEKELLTYKVGKEQDVRDMLSCIDVLVDGEFEEENKVLDLRFRGSTNQHIIDVKKSHDSDSLVLWEDTFEEVEVEVKEN